MANELSNKAALVHDRCHNNISGGFMVRLSVLARNLLWILDALWSKAVNQMTAWDSYRYTLTTEFTLDNYRQAETKINGTCDIEGNLHIYGEIMDTDLEIYQFGDVYYRQNTSTDKDSDWIILENSPLPNNEILLMELYPKQYLLPIDGTVEFIEKEKVDGIMEYRYHVTQ